MAGQQRLEALTGLRFIAAFLVLCFHNGFTKLPEVPQRLRNLGEYGGVSVTLFFVLSGFILAYRHVLAPSDRQSFWLARFARVYPVYAFSLLLALPWFLAETRTPNNPAASTPLLTGLAVILLVQAWLPQTMFLWNFPAWSLSAEAFFYAMFPRWVVSLARYPPRALAWRMAALWLAAQIPTLIYLAVRDRGILTGDQLYNLHMATTGNPLLRAPDFLLGVATGLWFTQGGSTRIPATFSLAVYLTVLMYFDELPAWARTSQSFLAPLFAVMILNLASGSGLAAWVLSRPLFVLLGDASYSLYILQIPVLRGLLLVFHAGNESVPRESWVYCLIETATVIGVSVVTYRYVERPAQRFLNRRISPRKPQVAV